LKVGIFGGTFDPFTIAHKEIVDKALKIVDKIMIIPTSITYYRDSNVPPLFNFDQRVEIINTWIVSGRVAVSAIEKGKPDTWRFIDTLNSLKDYIKGDEVYIIIGSDTLDKLDTWASYKEIIRDYKFIVADGRDHKYATNPLNISYIPIEVDNRFCSASKVREFLVENIKEEYLTYREVFDV